MKKHTVWIALFAVPLLYALSRFAPQGWPLLLGLGIHWLLAGAAIVWSKTNLGGPKDIGLHRPVKGFAIFVAVIVTYCVSLNLWFGGQSLANWQWSLPGLAHFGRWGYLLIAISAGFCEEVIYRGYMLTALKNAGQSAWAAIVLSTLSFVFFHGMMPMPMMVAGFVIGAIWASIVHKTSMLWITIYFHALWDATVALVPWVFDNS